ncbi:hypothetical protein GI584_01900 [Gracilibacillus salitolerans]|uniref:Uncharacterized protein n=1 Tax=Gracilibacillus salitolerans TaxID=2663022 RepID=A0A5Q2TG27_9BACI|nr:hypothetical protein [Gracilibacillus salitolerans]QGH32880.1 hypothetical protein GI584_01900 [Gracilibacillus salitolerans]
MNTPNNTMFKVTKDLFLIQMKWTFWYMLVVLVLFLIIPLFSVKMELNFLSTMYTSTKIYMLVIGIISSLAFFAHYVQNGITRKDYFSGSAIAAEGLAFSIMFIASIINGILYIIEPLKGYLPDNANIGFLDMTSTWMIPMLVFSLIIFGFYLAGWLIIAGYQRYGGWGCVAFILIALLSVSFIDLLWEGDITYPLINLLTIPSPNLSIVVSLICTIILVATGLLLIRSLTKRVTIQPK